MAGRLVLLACTLLLQADPINSEHVIEGRAGAVGYTTQRDCYVRTFGGQAGESRCHFPFTYKGVTYTQCSWLDNDGYPWCYTTPGGQQDNMWAFCQAEVCEECYVPTFGGQAGNSQCIFPFTYQGVEYDECSTVDNDGYPWCYTTPDYEEDKIWGFCSDKVCKETTKDIEPPEPSNEIPPSADCYVTTFGGRAGESRCYFPFNYKGVTYTECSLVENDGYPWCFTSPNYEQDQMWAFCDAKVCEECYVPTFSGKSGESRCVFPFTFKGVVYNECSTVESDGYPWCYTTPSYEQDKLWGFCKEEVCSRISENDLSKRRII